MLSKSQTETLHITEKFLSMIRCPDFSCKKLNYLMVLPKQADDSSQYTFPTGFGIVSASLKASGRTVYTLNLTYKDHPLELLKTTINKYAIDVVLTGGLSGQYSLLREIIDVVKQIRPNITVILGGGIITAEPDVAMQALENADYGVIGEGEITLNDLCYALESGNDVKKVDGLIIKSCDGKYLTTSPRKEIADLDCLPFPDYDGLDYIDVFDRKFSGTGLIKNVGVVIISSRSCPYNCTFCFHSSGKKYRRRSLDVVFQELDLLKEKFPIDFIQVADELFGNDIAYVRGFCTRIKSYGVHYRISTRIDRVTDELLGLLKDSGCEEILFGVEHISDMVLQSMNKKTSSALLEPTLRKCLQYGIRPVGNIIFGDLAETEDTVNEALDWWREHRCLGNITTTYLIVFPGSYVYKVACERGIINDPIQYLRDGCPLINITTMSDSKWAEMKDLIAKNRILYETDAEPVGSEQISETLDRLAEYSSVCVWPATHDSIRFFESFSEKFSQNTYFVNINPDSQMLRTTDVYTHIYSPQIISKKNIKLVICPRYSLLEQIRTICANDFPSVKRVVSIQDLGNLEVEELLK